MDKIRYEPSGARVVGPTLKVRADVFPGAVHLHVEDGEIFVGMITCHWNDNAEDARPKLLTVLDRIFAQIETNRQAAANG